METTSSSQKDDHSRPRCTPNCLLPGGRKCSWQMPDKLSSSAQERRPCPDCDKEGQTPLLPHPAITHSSCQLSALSFSSLLQSRDKKAGAVAENQRGCRESSTGQAVRLSTRQSRALGAGRRVLGSEPPECRPRQPEPAGNGFRQQTGASNGG